MPEDREFRIVGLGASPYTRKLPAAARFRRLPFRFVVAGSKEAKALPQRSLPLFPYFVAPEVDGALTQVQADSTPILTFLEEAYPQRLLRPADGALRFLGERIVDALIEDVHMRLNPFLDFMSGEMDSMKLAILQNDEKAGEEARDG